MCSNLARGSSSGKALIRLLRCFAITHAHLDHIQGLAISSAASLSAKPLFATASTIGVLERLFDGWIWPRLCGYASDGITIGRAYLYHTIPTTHVPLQLSESLSMITFLLSHGATYSDAPDTPNNNACPVYSSTAFLIREAVSGNEFLFFGDVEPGEFFLGGARAPLIQRGRFHLSSFFQPRNLAPCRSHYRRRPTRHHLHRVLVPLLAAKGETLGPHVAGLGAG